jgi:drug/metabolite transporter (DMT)-like permease
VKYNKKLYPSWITVGIAGAFDCMGSGLQTFALLFVPPSIYSIAKNATVVFTAFFSIVYLKKKLYRHQVISILIIMLGFISVALSEILFEKNDNPHHHGFNILSIVGIISLFISLIFQGFCYCYEEHIFDVYDINVAHLLGFESMMGAVVSTVLFLITMNIPCTHPEFCNAEVGQMLDNPPNAIYDLQYNNAWVYFILTCLSIMIFNLLGVFITKHSGAVFRVVLDTLRTITVWIISLIIGFETLTPFSKVALELFGFALLIVGNLLYNEILVINFCGLSKNIKKNREAREKEEYKQINSTEGNLE